MCTAGSLLELYSSDSAPQFCIVKESVCTVHHRFGYRTDPLGEHTGSLLSKRACSNSGQLVWWVNRAVRCVEVRQSHRTITGAVTVRAVRRSHRNLIDAPLVTSFVTSKSVPFGPPQPLTTWSQKHDCV